MLSHLRAALGMMIAFTLITGVAYPLAVTGVAQLAFPRQADGSILTDAQGKPIGSALIGQAFSRPEYLHPRPSAAGNGYDATQSGGSNYGPLDPRLAQRVAASAADLRKEAPGAVIPSDAVTASASGLDPEISPAYARLQAARIAKARGVAPAAVQSVIDAETRAPTFGVLGEARVNVLLVNRALDGRFPATR
jgi:K+-transporting ATPase ATPase C chain